MRSACGGRLVSGPAKRFGRCGRCGRIAWEGYEGDPCTREAGKVHRDLPVALAIALATLAALVAVARGWLTMR